MPAPPNGEVDFGVVDVDFLVDAYRGEGVYKKDGPRTNLRLIAKIEEPEYYMVATRREAFITDLRQIKDRKLPVRILPGQHPLPDDSELLRHHPRGTGFMGRRADDGRRAIGNRHSRPG